MKHSLLIASLFILSTACSSFSAKPKIVYHRPDLGSVENKVVVFPTLDFSGKKSKGAEEINRAVMTNWSQMYGAESIIPAGPVGDKIAESNPEFYLKLISSFDNVSAIEQLGNNKQFKSVLSKITKKLGNHHLAFSVINGDSKVFEEGKPVTIHFGLFDTKNLTWKWITKIEDTKGMMSKWAVSSNAMVSNSFSAAKDLESKRNPASQTK